MILDQLAQLPYLEVMMQAECDQVDPDEFDFELIESLTK